MDFIKVLAFNNDKAVRETVISSVLNYFLDPQGDHGLAGTLLERYLKAVRDQVSVIGDEFISAVHAFPRSKDLRCTVTSEWEGISDSEHKGRRLDSLVTIRYRDKIILLGTEVKIYGKSSSDDEQLGCYVKMLNEMRKELSEEENLPLESIYPILCYLIPNDSAKGFQFAREAETECMKYGVEGVVIVKWSKSSAGSVSEKVKATTESMEEMILSVLHAYQDGDISPADSQAIDLLRSLRNAAINRFVFTPPVYRKEGQFPTNAQYEEALSPFQFALLSAFRDAVKAAGVTRPLAANTRHTSIGVPAGNNPAKGSNNSLCRVLTVTSYEEGMPVPSFILQISKDKYMKHVDQIRSVLQKFPVQVVLDDKDDTGKLFYHENGQNNEPVYRIWFPEQSVPGSDGLSKSFTSLIEELRTAFSNR